MNIDPEFVKTNFIEFIDKTLEAYKAAGVSPISRRHMEL